MTIVEIIDRLKSGETFTKFILNDQASDTLIAQVEETIGIVLPDDVKLFYKNFNGIEEDGNYLFRIISLQDILDNFEKKYYRNIIFAEYMIYIDAWGFEFEKNEENGYVITTELYDSECKHITGKLIWTNSFTDFLTVLLESGFEGILDWEEQLRADSSRTFLLPKSIEQVPIFITKQSFLMKMLSKFSSFFWP